MYQILKDEYGFSKTGINSWWSDMVSKTRSAVQTAVDGAQQLMEPLTEALTAPADPFAAFDPQTFQVDVIEPSALPFQPMGLPDPELANVGFGMGEYFEQDAEAFVENYDVGDVLAAPEFTTVAQDEAFNELTRSNLQDQLISAPVDLEDDFATDIRPPPRPGTCPRGATPSTRQTWRPGSGSSPSPCGARTPWELRWTSCRSRSRTASSSTGWS